MGIKKSEEAENWEGVTSQLSEEACGGDDGSGNVLVHGHSNASYKLTDNECLVRSCFRIEANASYKLADSECSVGSCYKKEN